MFLKVLNILNPLLYHYKYNFKHCFPFDPYKQIKKIIQKKGSLKETEKKVLMVPFRMADSNLFEGNCSIILKSRGYTVDALLCGQAVTHCEQIDFSLNKNLRCNLCFYEQQKFISSFDLNGVFIHQYVSQRERKEIKQELDRLDLSDLKTYALRGIPIYRALTSSIQLHFKRATFCPRKDETVIKGYLNTIFTTIYALDNYFSKNTVEFILLSHGVYSSWGTVLEYCLHRSLKCVTWGREYNGAGIIAAHNASYLSEPMYELNSKWDHEKLTEKQREQIVDYLEAKIGINAKKYDFVDYNAHIKKLLPKKEIYEHLNLNIEKKIVALFPNIPWDGQTFRPNLIFNDINSWVCETVDWFIKRSDCILVIRAHPAEKYSKEGSGRLLEILEARYGKDFSFENIVFIPADSNITSVSVASISCAALLYGSTIGYETTFLRVPTVLASEFFYSNKEISFDAKTKDEYFSLIDTAIAGQLHVDNGRYERLLQYAFHYQFRRVMPETVMNLTGLNFAGYKYNDVKELVNDPVINKFIDLCITGEKFYFDEFYE